VRIGQFVLSASDTALRTFSLEIGYNSGIAGAPVQFGIGTFDLGAVPAPGAVALLGLAGLAGRRRR
jgi:MYXO-CTERM domain-containing protein